MRVALQPLAQSRDWAQLLQAISGAYDGDVDPKGGDSQRIVSLSIRVRQHCVASLSDYNAGWLHGGWIDCAGKDEAGIYAEINRLLSQSSEEVAEEYAIHDYEGFGGLIISEHAGVPQIVAYAALIETHGEAITHFVSHFGMNEERAAEAFEGSYRGHHESFRAFSDDLFDEIYAHDIP